MTYEKVLRPMKASLLNRVSVAGGAWVLSLAVLPMVSHAMGVSSAQAGSNPAVVVEFPGTATASDSGDDGTTPFPVTWSSTATASPGGISASVIVTGLEAEYRAGGSFTSASDTTFDYASDFQGGQSDWVEFELGGFLTGSVVGQGAGGTGSGFATISLSGPLYNSPNGAFVGNVLRSTGHQGGSVRSFDNPQQISINKSLSTGFYAVPRGAAISFSISMSITAWGDRNRFGGEHGTVTSNFSDTFKLNPDEIFNILTPGITVNSPSAGIVNNAFPAPVPVPGALFLFLPALASLAALSRRSTAKT